MGFLYFNISSFTLFQWLKDHAPADGAEFHLRAQSLVGSAEHHTYDGELGNAQAPVEQPRPLSLAASTPIVRAADEDTPGMVP